MDLQNTPSEFFLHHHFKVEADGHTISCRDIHTERIADDDIRYVKDNNSFMELWRKLPDVVSNKNGHYRLYIEKFDSSVFYKKETDDAMADEMYLETFFGKNGDLLEPMQKMYDFLKEEGYINE